MPGRHSAPHDRGLSYKGVGIARVTRNEDLHVGQNIFLPYRTMHGMRHMYRRYNREMKNITLTERALAVVDYCTERNNQHCPGQPSDGGSNPRLPLDTAASIATPRVRHCHGRYATNRFYCRSTYPSLRELALPNRLLLITQSM